MKLKRGIFYRLKISCVLCAVLGVMCVGTPVMAATVSNGCDKDDNNRIVPMLALCSTHVYNLGLTENPTNASDRQLMRDVVALKSTVIMQQMYKQYEYIEATVQRLKTQLEREILTTKFETAGASSSERASSGSSLTGNNGVTGAENCINAGLTKDVMECLSRNLDRITTAINDADIGAAKRQLETDMGVLRMFDRLEKNECEYDEDEKPETYSTPYCEAHKICTSASKKNNRQEMMECVNTLRVCISLNLEELQRNTNVYNPFVR